MTATTKIAIGPTEAKVVIARAEYSRRHERWLDALLARDKTDTEAGKNQEAHRLESAGLVNDSGKDLFFQRTVLKLLWDVQRMIAEIRKEKLFHETHCVKEVDIGQS